MYYVYIITNKNNKTLYIGVTNNLYRRISEHKDKLDLNSFSARYNLNKLVYFELFETPSMAIFREKQIKKYSRIKKDNLINQRNPEWKDLLKDN